MFKTSKLDQMPEILTLQQACEALNCHPNTLRNWDKRGVLVAIRFGTRRDRRYRLNDIKKILQQD